MTTGREQVLGLVASGKISAAEGDQLLTAMSASKPKAKPWQWVFAPLDVLSPMAATAASVLGVVAAAVLMRMHCIFLGLFTVQTSPKLEGSPSQIAAAVALAWPIPALVAWGVALVGARSTRYRDLLLTVGLAKLPLVVVGAVGLALEPIDAADTGRGLALAAVALPLMGISVTQFILGFRTASGVRGGKLAALVVLAIVAAEAAGQVGFIVFRS